MSDFIIWLEGLFLEKGKYMASNLVVINLLAVVFFISSFSDLYPMFSGVSSFFLVFIIFFQFFYIKKIRLLSLLIPLFVFIFQGFYICKSLIYGSVDVHVALNNSRYMMISLLSPAVFEISKFGGIPILISKLSKIVILKALVVSILAIGLLLDIDIFKSYSKHTDLLVHPFMGGYRVFDSFVVFFLLAFFEFKYRSLACKMLIFCILTFYVLVSMSFGVVIVYFIMISIFLVKFFLCGRLNRILIFSVFLVLFGTFVFLSFTVGYEFFEKIYYASRLSELVQDKLITSVGVKKDQVYWLLDNTTLFGQGVGVWFNIQGRIDSVLEVLHVYWVATYGVVGVTVFYLVIVVIPFMKTVFLNQNEELVIVFGTFASILLCSFTNPYALSGFVFLLVLLVYAYDPLIYGRNSLINSKNIKILR